MKRTIAFVLVTLVLAWACIARTPAAAARSAPAPAQALDPRFAEFDTLVAHWRFAAAESVAKSLRADLVRAPHVDTLLAARASFDVVRSLQMQIDLRDSAGWAGASEALAWLNGRRDVPDTLRLGMHRSLAWRLLNTRHPDEMIGHVRAALDLARRHPEWGPGPEGAVLYDLGLGLQARGEPESALVVLRRAVDVRRRAKLPVDHVPGEALATIGSIDDALGRDDEALRAFHEGMQEHVARFGPDDVRLGYILSRIGAFHFRRGNYADAYEAYEECSRLDVKDPDSPNAVITRAGMAQCLDQLGDVERARVLLEPLMPKVEKLWGATSSQALVFDLTLASAYVKTGRHREAHDLLERVVVATEHGRSPFDRVLLLAALTSEATLHERRGENDSMLAVARHAEAIAGASGQQEPSVLIQALSLQLHGYARLGRFAEADSVDARLDHVLAGSMLQGNNLVDDAWVARSELAENRGRHADAIAAAAAGARSVRERIARNARALSDRQALMLAMSLSPPLDQLLLLGAGTGPDADRRCWDEVARLRGLVRAEMSRRHLAAGDAADTALARAHAAWVAASRQLAEQEVAMAGAPADAAADSALRARRAAVDEAERLLPRTSGARLATADPSAVGLDSVLAHLATGEALAGFVQVPRGDSTRHVFAFVARGGSRAVRSVDLGEVGELEPLVRAWMRALGEPDPARRSEAAARRVGEAVRRAIWDPVASLASGARSIAIVPEAPVYGLPWDALPAAGGRYLVESGPRVRVLGAERELVAPDAGEGSGLLAIGGVDFDRDSSGAVAASAGSTRAPMSECDRDALTHLPPLPGTAREARDLADAWSRSGEGAGAALRLEGAAATEAAFKSLAQGRRVLHLATHGIALGDTCRAEGAGTRGVGGVTALEPSAPAAAAHAPPRRTVRRKPVGTHANGSIPEPPVPSPWLGRQVMLALAGANHALDPGIVGEDGLLTAEEVTTLDLRGVDWVVLSACHSGLGEAWAREGELGMERAFRLAGARTVIASQWAVGDEATSEWMRALYDARANGATAAAEALARADRAVLAARRASGRSTHPFFWAAFTAHGE